MNKFGICTDGCLNDFENKTDKVLAVSEMW